MTQNYFVSRVEEITMKRTKKKWMASPFLKSSTNINHCCLAEGRLLRFSQACQPALPVCLKANLRPLTPSSVTSPESHPDGFALAALKRRGAPVMPQSARNEQRHTPTHACGAALLKSRVSGSVHVMKGALLGLGLATSLLSVGLLGIKRQDLFYFQAWLSAFKAAHSHDFVLSRSHAKQKEPYFLSRSLSAALI